MLVCIVGSRRFGGLFLWGDFMDVDIDQQMQEQDKKLVAIMQSIQIRALRLAVQTPGSIVAALVREARREHADETG